MAPERCPTCNTELGTWSDDPILTPLGLSGEDYIGITFPNFSHIIELRDFYNDLEVQLGISTTVWSDDLEGGLIILNRTHIEELRLAIENILSNQSSNLSEYFNEAGRSNTDWTDINRNNEGSLPLLPTAKTIIKAIHIEELRIGAYIEAEVPEPGGTVRVLWLERFNGSYSDSGFYSVINPYGWHVDPNFKSGIFAGNHAWSGWNARPTNVVVGSSPGSGSSGWSYTQNSISLDTSTSGANVTAYTTTSRKTGASSIIFPATSKISISGLSFEGSNSQVVAKITFTLEIYKMRNQWWGTKERSVTVALWFYSQIGSFTSFIDPSYFVENGVLKFRNLNNIFPQTEIWNPISSMNMNVSIVDAMQDYAIKHPEVSLPQLPPGTNPPDIGLVEGDEYINSMKFNGMWFDFITAAQTGHGSSSSLNFSIGEIKFYVIE